MQYIELNQYFNSRFEELLNKRTPDSYRVKSHNVLSIFEELCDLIEGWNKRRIQSPETVILCAEECIKLMEDDSWIDYSFYDKALLKDEITGYKAILENKEKRNNIYEISNKLKYACRKCIDINSNIYAENLFTYLIAQIKKTGDIDEKCYVKTMDSFEKALSFLCTEMLRLGYSKNFLYKNAQKLKDGKLNIDRMKQELLGQKAKKFRVIFKIQSNNYIAECKNAYNLVEKLEIELKSIPEYNKTKIHNFIETEGNKLFREFTVVALDTYAAIKKAKESMALLLDTLYLGNEVEKGKIHSQVLVLSDAGGLYPELRNHNYELDGNYDSNPEMSKLLKEKVDIILNNNLVKEDVKERLKSALRHLRMANNSKDLELRFVNYWIALEFIFSSPINNENTFGRIKTHLINILIYSYGARNVKYLEKLLHEDGSLPKTESLLKMDDDKWHNLIDVVKDKRTQYRLCKIKSNLHSKDNINAYISVHRKNLEWHIARIYRMRNELIHEAALTQDIEGVTSNLRFYLVFLLNQIVNYFSTDNKMQLSINDFFYEYENKANVVLLKKERDYVLNANYYEMNLIC